MGFLWGRSRLALGVLWIDTEFYFIELIAKHPSIELAQCGKLSADEAGWFELSYLAKTRALYLAIPAIKFIQKEIPTTALSKPSQLQAQYFSEISEGLAFDFISDSFQSDKTRVFAVREIEIQHYLKILSPTPFKIKAIEPDSYAIYRACQRHYKVALNPKEAGLFQLPKRAIFFDAQSILFDIASEATQVEQSVRQFALHYPHYTLKKNILIAISDFPSQISGDVHYLSALGAALRGIL